MGRSVAQRVPASSPARNQGASTTPMPLSSPRLSPRCSPLQMRNYAPANGVARPTAPSNHSILGATSEAMPMTGRAAMPMTARGVAPMIAQDHQLGQYVQEPLHEPSAVHKVIRQRSVGDSIFGATSEAMPMTGRGATPTTARGAALMTARD